MLPSVDFPPTALSPCNAVAADQWSKMVEEWNGGSIKAISRLARPSNPPIDRRGEICISPSLSDCWISIASKVLQLKLQPTTECLLRLILTDRWRFPHAFVKPKHVYATCVPSLFSFTHYYVLKFFAQLRTNLSPFTKDFRVRGTDLRCELLLEGLYLWA